MGEMRIAYVIGLLVRKYEDKRSVGRRRRCGRLYSRPIKIDLKEIGRENEDHWSGSG
jgi:hypothetical protein